LEGIEKELLPPKELILGTTAIYFLLMLMAVVYFEIENSFLIHGAWHVHFAYIPAVFLSSYFGYRFASWYEVVGNERNTLEIICAPICILFLSVAGASLCWGFSFFIIEEPNNFSLLPCVVLAIGASLAFLHFVWPILLVGGIIASLLANGLARFLTSRSTPY
jgi:hypothetical protein